VSDKNNSGISWRGLCSLTSSEVDIGGVMVSSLASSEVDIGGVMVSSLASSEVDSWIPKTITFSKGWFEPLHHRCLPHST
jgi:hypothetical protein